MPGAPLRIAPQRGRGGLRRSRRNLKKREHRLDKVHMPRGVHTMSDRIIAPVTFGIRRVAKEDAWDGSWCELVWHGGRGARITETLKDAGTIIGRWCAEEKVVRGVVLPRATRTNVN